MLRYDDNMAHGASRLRTPTLEHYMEDMKLMEQGILDFHSFRSGYELHNHPVEIMVHDSKGKLKQISRTHNLRTNAGGTAQANIMANPGSSQLKAYYIGVTTTTITPNDADTALSGELTGSGLARKAATFNLTGAPSGTTGATAQGTFTLNVSWSVTATATIWGCAVFDQLAIGGTMWFEAAIANPGVGVNSGDTLALTYTINY